MYVSERLLKTQIPRKFSRLTMKDVEERVNNPTDSYGVYFYH